MLDIFKSKSSLDEEEDDPRGKKQDEGPIEHLIKGIISDDIPSLGDRIFENRVLPTITGLLKGVAHDAIDGIFRSDRNEYYYSSLDSGNRIDYRGRSGGRSSSGVANSGSFIGDSYSNRDVGNRRAFNSRDYAFTRGEAEVTLDELKAKVANLGKADLATFLSHTNVTPTWNDYNIGWTDLSTAFIRDIRTNDGVRYVVVLPQLVSIK